MNIDRKFKTFQYNGLVHAFKDYDPIHVVSGDTDSCYIDLSAVFEPDANEDDVIEFADEIGERVNDTFPQFMKDIFNVDKDRSHPIETDREIVATKGILLAKKKYVLHIINNEGIKCDKLKMMGVEIKKTDTPKLVQKLLKDLVELLLVRTSYDKVRSFLEDFKEEYFKKTIREVGVPSSVKSLKKYEKIFNVTQSTKGFPSHVKASMNYNNLCGVNDRKIMTGEKVLVAKVTHPKFDRIAITVDVEVVPEFVQDMVIDWNAQWETVNKKIDIYLKPIGYDKASRQKQTVKSILQY